MIIFKERGRAFYITLLFLGGVFTFFLFKKDFDISEEWYLILIVVFTFLLFMYIALSGVRWIKVHDDIIELYSGMFPQRHEFQVSNLNSVQIHRGGGSGDFGYINVIFNNGEKKRFNISIGNKSKQMIIEGLQSVDVVVEEV